MAGPGEEGRKDPEVERLQRELDAARAEASRYKGAHQQQQAKQAEAERRAAVRKAGALTKEEQAAVDRMNEVDPTGKAAMDAINAANERRQLAMLETGAPDADPPARPAAAGFDDAVTRSMGGEGWKDTITSDEYARWFNSQAPDVQELGRTEDPAAAVRVLTMYEQSKGGGMRRSVDPRIEGAAAAPGSRSLTMGGTRDVGRHVSEDGDEDEYMWGWNYAGKQFEDQYQGLNPKHNEERYEAIRARR